MVTLLVERFVMLSSAIGFVASLRVVHILWSTWALVTTSQKKTLALMFC
jgi:hypothetical protein